MLRFLFLSFSSHRREHSVATGNLSLSLWSSQRKSNFVSRRTYYPVSFGGEFRRFFFFFFFCGGVFSFGCWAHVTHGRLVCWNSREFCWELKRSVKNWSIWGGWIVRCCEFHFEQKFDSFAKKRLSLASRSERLRMCEKKKWKFTLNITQIHVNSGWFNSEFRFFFF